MGVRAIDVSRYQGHIDWKAVAASGVRGAWIKVGGADGPTGAHWYKDSRADENLTGAQAAGLEVGTYYFCNPSLPPVDQARHAVSCGHGRGRLWPWADLETNPSGLTSVELDRWLTQFCTAVRGLCGRESVWYGGRGTGIGWSTSAPACPVAIANYGPNRPGTTPPHLTGPLSDGRGGPALPPMFSRWHVWQFNSTTTVPGITAETVDQDLVADDFWAAMTGQPDPRRLAMKAVSVPQSNAQWVLVFDGNGRPRRFGLTGTDAGDAVGQAYLDGSVALEGAAADWFWGLPESNPVTADTGALQLCEIVRQDIAGLADALKAVTAALAGQPATADDPVVGEALAKIDELVDRITAAGHALEGAAPPGQPTP